MKYPAVIQIRNGSTRLPGKALLQILGKPVIYYLLERVKNCKAVSEITVATTTEKSDDPLVEYCRQNSINFYRGETDDVLKRISDTIKNNKDDYFVKFWGDSPLIDPNLVDYIISEFETKYRTFDYISNNHPSTYPEGMQIEIIRSKVLTKLNKFKLSKEDREHVTSLIWKNPKLFKISNIENINNTHDKYRIVIDFPEDFNQIKKIIEALYPKDNLFSLKSIIQFLDEHPEIKNINAKHYETEGSYNRRIFKIPGK